MKIPDEVILVDEHDHEIGVMDKLEAHRDGGKLHRAISVFLFNSKGETLIQRRSTKKIVGASLWANTCCGNVRPGETRVECATRRLKEELGIGGVNLHKADQFTYAVKCNEEFSEREIDGVYVGMYEGEVHPNPDEVSEYAWVLYPKLESEAKNLDTKDKFAPWFLIMMNDERIMKNVLSKVKNI